MVVSRLALNQHLQAKHERYIVKSNLCTVGREGINNVGWVPEVETQCGNDDITRSFDCSAETFANQVPAFRERWCTAAQEGPHEPTRQFAASLEARKKCREGLITSTKVEAA